MRAVVVANGGVNAEDRAVVDAAELVVCADGGARHCAEWGIVPQLVVGDLDSLGGAPARETRAYPRDKDETDLELAIAAARERGAVDITLVGALGGSRADHDAANLLLLASPRYADLRLSAVRGGTRVRAVRAGTALTLGGAPGDLVSLLAVAGDAEGIDTDGLRYPLGGSTLVFGTARGVSNVIERSPASVRLARGALLVFEIAAR